MPPQTSASLRRIALPGLLALVALAGCGTRLPDKDVTAGQQQVVTGPGGVTATTGPNGVVPTLSGLPSAASSSGGTQNGNSNAGGSIAPVPGNTASDIGVTANSITIGTIASKTNPFDPRAFVGPTYGLQAFVQWTNAHGGIHGRRLILKFCDDQGSGDQNQACVHQLIDSAKVFALASTAILDHQGAAYVNSKGVPDIGSQPIDPAFDKYPHLWEIYGDDYPRDGKQFGFNNQLYGGTEIYHWFSKHFSNVPKVAGVVEYNQSASSRLDRKSVV